MSSIDVTERLAGYDDEAVIQIEPGTVLQREECGNCGVDLSDYQPPDKPSWSVSKGRTHCKECPSCGWDPTWYSGTIEDHDHNVILSCEKCREENVQRERRQLVHYYLNGPGDLRKTRKVLSRFGTSKRCAACREKNQAAIHYANYKRALERADEKRESQRRGVLKFKQAEANKRAARKEKK